MTLYLVWDSEGISNTKDTIVEDLFNAVERDSSDSETEEHARKHRKTGRGGKVRKVKSESSGSGSGKSGSGSDSEEKSKAGKCRDMTVLKPLYHRLSIYHGGHCLQTMLGVCVCDRCSKPQHSS